MDINLNNSILFNVVDKSNIEAKASRVDKMEDEKLKEVCQDFESIFLYMMMKEMKNTVPEGGLIEKSQASLIFEDMYMEEMSKEIAKTGEGMGLSKILYDQLSNRDKLVIR